MAKKGLLIDYNYCTGCHSCEMACKQELGLSVEQFGIKVSKIGPWKIDDSKWQYDYIPTPPDLCDLCEERLAEGKLPSCVHHCQSACMYFGTLEELVALMEGKPKTVLYSPM